MAEVLKIGRTTYNVPALLSITEEEFVKMHKNIKSVNLDHVKHYLKKQPVKIKKDDLNDNATTSK